MQLSETVASINCHAGNLVNQTNNSMKKRNERRRQSHGAWN